MSATPGNQIGVDRMRPSLPGELADAQVRAGVLSHAAC